MNFGKNIQFLTKVKGMNQGNMLDAIGFKRTTWNAYANEKSFPKFEDLVKIAEYFGINETDLIHTDLSNVQLNKNEVVKKDGVKVQLNVQPNVQLNAKKTPKEPCQECIVKDAIIEGNKQLLHSKQELIEQLNTNIKLLQNQIDTMQYNRREAAESQHTSKREQKSA